MRISAAFSTDRLVHKASSHMTFSLSKAYWAKKTTYKFKKKQKNRKNKKGARGPDGSQRQPPQVCQATSAKCHSSADEEACVFCLKG